MSRPRTPRSRSMPPSLSRPLSYTTRFCYVPIRGIVSAPFASGRAAGSFKFHPSRRLRAELPDFRGGATPPMATANIGTFRAGARQARARRREAPPDTSESRAWPAGLRPTGRQDQRHGNGQDRDAPHPEDRSGGAIDLAMVPWRLPRRSRHAPSPSFYHSPLSRAASKGRPCVPLPAML